MSDRSPHRLTSEPAFWEARYAAHDALFGDAPDAFVRALAADLPQGASVLDLGAGDGRNTRWLADAGFRVAALEFTPSALAVLRQIDGVDVIRADLRTWTPAAAYDAVVLSLVHLLPDERRRLWQQVRNALRPGGRFAAQLFHADHALPRYTAGGPTRADRLVDEGELRRAFQADDLLCCERVDTMIQAGPYLHGRAALLFIDVRRAPDSSPRSA